MIETEKCEWCGIELPHQTDEGIDAGNLLGGSFVCSACFLKEIDRLINVVEASTCPKSG